MTTKMNIAFAALLSMLSFSLSAQTFPSIETEQLDGHSLNIPADLNGKMSIVFLAFTPEAEQMLDNWYAPVYTLFLDPNGINSMAYDCHVKLVMMFTGIGQSLADDIQEKVRANVSEDFNDYFLFYEGPFKDAMKDLGLKKKDDAYVFVLDENGKIIFQDSGRYSESKIDKISELVEL